MKGKKKGGGDHYTCVELEIQTFGLGNRKWKKLKKKQIKNRQFDQTLTMSQLQTSAIAKRRVISYSK